ncbi:MAG: potassium channel family protein [Pseudomonadota bacterium]
MQALTTALIVSTLTGLCVLVHFEALNQLMLRLGQHAASRRLLVVHMLGLLAVHVVEIWIFGIGIYAMSVWLGIGGITGGAEGLLDYIYFSAMIYTTVGFGDLVPHGALRLVAGMEALAGLSMITWSASYTFLLMQRLWKA